VKKEVIVRLHASFEELVQTDSDGAEFWRARDLQDLLGYTRCENFSKVIDKARTSCKTAGYVEDDHFLEVRKMIDLGKGATRPIEDVALTR
jgi:DNA-damage-inducible protein D